MCNYAEVQTSLHAVDTQRAGYGLTPVYRTGGVPARASDRVFAELVAAIRDLRLTPGQSLSEAEVAEELQVSRTPLREAIARLVEHGLVQVVPQVGTKVSRISLGDVEEARFIRESLEVAAFELASTDTERDVRRLRELLTVQQRAYRSRDPEAFFAADEQMHEQIFAMSGHPGAWRTVQRAKLQLDRLRRLSLPEPTTLKQLVGDHTRIVDALEHGEVAEGRDHISIHARRVLEHAPALRRKHPDYFIE